MPAGPLIAGGASILGGVLGGKGAKKAAKAEVALGRDALALQEKMFNKVWDGTAVGRELGQKSMGDAYAMLQPGYDYKTSPGYDFRFDEGQRAVESSAASKGMLMSGGNLKDLVRFGDGVASADYGDSFNRYSTLAGLGNASMNTGANAASNFAQGGANTLQGIGQAKASGYAGMNQAIQGTLGNLAGIFGGMGGF
jgi:hypothetical protein